MDQTRKNEIAAVVLFTASFFLFLSIFTFNEQDLSFYTSSPNVVPQNVIGVVGAYVGGVLLLLMGKAAYVIPILILVWGASRLMQIEASRVFFKLFGTVVLVMAVSASLSIMADASRATAFTGGGLLGILVSGFLLEYLGRVGSNVFIVAMIVLSLLIATEFLIFPILVAAFKFCAKIPSRIAERIPERAAAKVKVSEPRESRIRAARQEIARKLEGMKKQVEDVRRTALARSTADETVEAGTAPAFKPSISKEIKPKKAPMSKERVTQISGGASGEKEPYKMPSLGLLKSRPAGGGGETDESLKARALTLEKTLLDFGVEAKVVKINKGPVITMYELEPAVGTRVNKVTTLADNISLAMKSSNIRIVAPLPGKGTIGIEVPNLKSEMVFLKDVLETEDYTSEESPLKLALGKDILGNSMVLDLARMPHLLIAGATGSGKTVCINSIISSCLFNASPDELKILMIDPKRVELMIFAGIPHLVAPIVTNPKKAAAALNWVVGEMERRYEVFAEAGVRNIAAYKERAGEDDENLPYIMVVVDELADLMMVAQQDIEGAIMRIAQLSRAAGIHMILATQRPSVNVITGVIKANFPARISFAVMSQIDSRTILDSKGAEKLLGRGDMLLMEPGESALIRGQCSFVEDSEIRTLVKFLKSQTEPQYIEEVMAGQDKKALGVEQEKDDLYLEAVRIVVETRQASVSMVQRKLRVGYTRAARMIDIMETEGIVGAHNGSKAREILVESMDEVEEK